MGSGWGAGVGWELGLGQAGELGLGRGWDWVGTRVVRGLRSCSGVKLWGGDL